MYSSRLALYRLGLLPVHRLPLSVISIGNLVVGGTGKTPHTALLADHFRRRGRNVVILSRGYGGEKSANGAVISSPEQIIGTLQEGGEEPFWLAEHVPGVAVVIGKNRYQAGLLSRERWGADLAILDDGFQHLGLERNVNILLIPAHQPFGTGGLLPLGTLREPRKQIKRADVVIISHTEMIAAGEQSALEGQVKALHPEAPVFFSRHVPLGVWKYPKGESRPLSWLKGKRVLAFCGLGQPESFRHSLKTPGSGIGGPEALQGSSGVPGKRQTPSPGGGGLLKGGGAADHRKGCPETWELAEGQAELLVLAIGVEIPDTHFWEVLETKIQLHGFPAPLFHKILIRSTNWLGDALLTTPAIHSIKTHFPEAELTVLARPGVAQVFETNPDIRQVIIYENKGRHRGLRGKWLLAKALKQQHFEVVVHFPHSFESAWISFLSGIPVRVGYATEGRGRLLTQARPLPPGFNEQHQVLSFIQLLEGLGIREIPDPERHPLRLRVAENWKDQAGRRLSSFGVITR